MLLAILVRKHRQDTSRLCDSKAACFPPQKPTSNLQKTAFGSDSSYPRTILSSSGTPPPSSITEIYPCSQQHIPFHPSRAIYAPTDHGHEITRADTASPPYRARVSERINQKPKLMCAPRAPSLILDTRIYRAPPPPPLSFTAFPSPPLAVAEVTLVT